MGGHLLGGVAPNSSVQGASPFTQAQPDAFMNRPFIVAGCCGHWGGAAFDVVVDIRLNKLMHRASLSSIPLLPFHGDIRSPVTIAETDDDWIGIGSPIHQMV